MCSESAVFLCSLQSLCHALSFWVNHNATARRWLLPSPSLAGSHTWCPVPPVVEGWHSRDNLYYLIQWVESKDGTTWELIRGLGYSGLSLSSCPSLSLDNLLYREDFFWSTQGSHDLSSCGEVSPKYRRLEGVRIWKLSKTYPGEKPPSLSVLTHRYSLATRKPTRHLLTMPYILVRIGAPYEGELFVQFHLPRNMAPSLTQEKFIEIWINLNNSIYNYK